MSLLLATALAVAPANLPTCSWDRPGANPFTGNVVEAVDRYTDIPQAVRKALKQRMVARQYDEIATIGRDAITGQQRYSPEIRDMHFGNGTVCRTVTRKQWPEAAVERGLVYCESGHCLIVPTVCRNLSRVTRLLPERAAAADGAAPRLASAGSTAGGAPGTADDGVGGRAQALAAPGDGELQFDAPGAGASFAQLAAADAPIVATPSIAPNATSGVAAMTGPGFAATAGSMSAPTSGSSVDGGSVNAPGAPDGLDPGRVGAAPPVPGAPPFMSGGGGGGGGGPFIAPTTTETSTTPVPEPGTWALMSLGALAVLGAARRRRRAG